MSTIAHALITIQSRCISSNSYHLFAVYYQNTTKLAPLSIIFYDQYQLPIDRFIVSLRRTSYGREKRR